MNATRGVAIDGDGRILVGGTALVPNGATAWWLAALLPE
jgi:hypothetical protein